GHIGDNCIFLLSHLSGSQGEPPHLIWLLQHHANVKGAIPVSGQINSLLQEVFFLGQQRHDFRNNVCPRNLSVGVARGDFIPFFIEFFGPYDAKAQLPLIWFQVNNGKFTEHYPEVLGIEFHRFRDMRSDNRINQRPRAPPAAGSRRSNIRLFRASRT
ncbi:MAG TPA: hypothetical protein DC024_13300, partial [Clostridiales bacterium]|nr:hypothetical protein [Clostridiales bacterium]